MFEKTKAFAVRHKDTLAKTAGVSIIASLVGAQLLQNQRRANDRADMVRADILSTIDEHLNKDK